ncbi:hypothetical protein PVT67_08340 [Gallaecimonas kandeliae]|uniref:hypothetical protein n=1 Tax=Gallaecimonas kandeliae TaxID=3029055 RepID=UPI002649C4D5|nr:hypothetical protein [Gallaecimonas kandeliae]WKE67231.1 hypothetical protein PVT67_08340 [Gallaecimonas kandeliae]
MRLLRWILYALILVGLDRELEGGWHWPTAVLLGLVFALVLLEWGLGIRQGRALGQATAAWLEAGQLVVRFGDLELRSPRAGVRREGRLVLAKAGPYRLRLPLELFSEADRQALD